MIKIFIFGITGKIGKNLINFIKLNKNFLIVGGINKKNFTKLFKIKSIFLNMKNGIFLDFSNNSLIIKILYISKKYKIPIIIGSTGFNLYELNFISYTSNFISILLSYNMSIGLNIINFMLTNSNIYFKKYNFNSLIFDIHHNEKIDSPSGTSLMLFSKLKFINLNIFSARIKNVIGNHIIYFFSNYELIKIEHFVINRKIFVLGIFYSIFWILKKIKGCYSMYDVFFNF